MNSPPIFVTLDPESASPMLLPAKTPMSLRSVMLGSLLGIVSAGCSSKPTPIEPPPLEAEPMAAAAMTEYDTNNDGQLSTAELKRSPGLAKALRRLDQDKNKSLSTQELVDAIQNWVDAGVAVSSFSCRVTKGGKPLEGALVKFVPESFFQGLIQPAEGKTNATGVARMSIDPSHLPSDLQNLRAIHQGMYRVEITHPTVEIPAKYNTESTLGVYVTFDSGSTFVQFKL